MKISHLLPFFLLPLLIFVLLAEALPSELVSIDSHTTHSMQLIFRNESWSVVDGMVEMASLELDENGQLSHSVLLGVPTNSVQWRVISAESTSIQLDNPLSKMPLVTLKTDIHLRDQPVVQLIFNPVQFEESGARVYSKIVVELTWDELAVAKRPNHPAYEQLLSKTLLNYETLDRPTVQTAHIPQIQPKNSNVPTLRITTTEAGLYGIPFAELMSAGFPIDNPAELRLTNRGLPIATVVQDDSLLFFGEAYEDLYTNQNVYWLTLGAGTQMETLNETHPNPTMATQFATTVHLEENTFYWNTMPDGEGEDHWFWGERISPNSTGLDTQRSYTATLPTVAQTPMITMRVQLKGHTTLAHKTRISLNGTLVDEQNWVGQTTFTHTIPVTGSLLIAGENVITVESADAGTAVDQLYINWIEIDYAATYTAINDTLFFAPPAAGTYSFTVTGFTTDSLYLFDITDPRQPRQISHTVHNGSLHFQQTVTEGTRFFATALTTVPKSALDSVSNWKDTGNSADWLIITHSDFITPAKRLADHRHTQGMQTAMIDIQDIYDEFGHGLFDPEAIREFLAYTHANWQTPAPTYVVLLGDGSQDYKDQLNTGSRNFVPPRMIETFDRGQIPSDHWYVTFAGDDIFEEMFVGRLSAETFAQANAIVDNIITYENRPAPDNQLALFVADDREDVFESNSELLIDKFPDLFDIERLYARTYTTPTMTRDISETLLSGTTFVNYAGHGNYYRWGSYVAEGRGHRIFTEVHADILADSGLNPFVTVADCLNGFFSIPSNAIIEPYDEALAEALQRPPNGGAVAIWTDAGLGYTSEQRILMGAFYDTLFTDQITTLGPSTNIAKAELYASSTYWEQNVRTMTLFGDPATRLHITESVPTAVNLTHNQTSSANGMILFFSAIALLLLSRRIVHK